MAFDPPPSLCQTGQTGNAHIDIDHFLKKGLLVKSRSSICLITEASASEGISGTHVQKVSYTARSNLLDSNNNLSIPDTTLHELNECSNFKAVDIVKYGESLY